MALICRADLYGHRASTKRFYGLYAAERGEKRFMPWMWDMDSWHGNCGVTSGWSVWKRPISAIWSEDIEERPEFASVDVSFISLSKILPPAAALLAQDGERWYV